MCAVIYGIFRNLLYFIGNCGKPNILIMDENVKIEMEFDNPVEEKKWWENLPILSMLFRYKLGDKIEELSEEQTQG